MNKSGAVNYLVPPSGFIWAWEEDYSAVKWRNGNTIAVWPELHALINHLVPYGLPPLGSKPDGWDIADAALGATRPCTCPTSTT